MQESPFGFEYSWADLKPIRALVLVVGIAQVIGAFVGLAYAPQTDGFLRLWFGGAVVTLPAFMVGAWVQAQWRPGSIGENKVMVRRFGLIAAVLSLAALAMPQLGFV